MVARRPTLYLLTGLPCSGKSTYATRLASSGVVVVPVDEMLVATVGRLGVDYEHAEHLELLEPIVASARELVGHHLSAGRDVVFDHGLGRRADRDELKRFAEDHGADWELRCFDASMSTLQARCRQRAASPGTVPISRDALEDLAASWERPTGEGEIVVVTD